MVVLVSRANFEIQLGGLDAFFYNSAGNEAVSTVAALEAVGATRAASALRAANALFPGGAPPRHRQKRFAGLEVVRKLPKRPLTSLEKKVGRDEPDVFSLLCSFIEAHAKELQGPGGGVNAVVCRRYSRVKAGEQQCCGRPASIRLPQADAHAR